MKEGIVRLLGGEPDIVTVGAAKWAMITSILRGVAAICLLYTSMPKLLRREWRVASRMSVSSTRIAPLFTS